MYEDFMYEFGDILAESLSSMLTSSLLSIATYVLLSLGMYTIAKRRGIRNPWLAWLPIGSSWILGSISDHYRYSVRREIKSKRKILITLEIILYVLLIVIISCAVVTVVQTIQFEMNAISPYDYEETIMGPAVSMILAVFPMLGVAIALAILQYMALYDLYRSTVPENATLFLVLSILIGITQPILVFINRKKDDGMYPAPNPYAPQQAYQPGYNPQQAYQPQQPMYPQQAYQPQQPMYPQQAYQPQQPVYPQQPAYQPPQQSAEIPQAPVQETDPWNRPENI